MFYSYPCNTTHHWRCRLIKHFEAALGCFHGFNYWYLWLAFGPQRNGLLPVIIKTIVTKRVNTIDSEYWITVHWCAQYACIQPKGMLESCKFPLEVEMNADHTSTLRSVTADADDGLLLIYGLHLDGHKQPEVRCSQTSFTRNDMLTVTMIMGLIILGIRLLYNGSFFQRCHE